MKIDLDKLWEPEAYEQSYPPGYSPSLTGKLVLPTDKIEPLPAQDISMNILDDLAYFEQKINKALYGLRAPSVQEEYVLGEPIDTHIHFEQQLQQLKSQFWIFDNEQIWMPKT